MNERKYNKIYICPLYDECPNRACFIHNPHNRKEYHRKLGGVSFRQCIEKFNEVFECRGQKLKLLEVDFSYKRGVTMVPAPEIAACALLKR